MKPFDLTDKEQEVYNKQTEIAKKVSPPLWYILLDVWSPILALILFILMYMIVCGSQWIVLLMILFYPLFYVFELIFRIRKRMAYFQTMIERIKFEYGAQHISSENIIIFAATTQFAVYAIQVTLIIGIINSLTSDRFYNFANTHGFIFKDVPVVIESAPVVAPTVNNYYNSTTNVYTMLPAKKKKK